MRLLVLWGAFSGILATKRALVEDEFDFEPTKLGLGLKTTTISNDTKLVSLNSPKVKSDPRKGKKKKRACLDFRLSELAVVNAALIDPNQDISTPSIIFRIAARKSFKIYAAVLFGVIVVWLNPWLMGHANPILFASCVEFIAAMLRRTPTEVTLCDQSPIFLALVALMKAETLIFHLIINFGVVNKIGLSSWHVAILFLLDLYLGFKLNSLISGLMDESTSKAIDRK